MPMRTGGAPDGMADRDKQKDDAAAGADGDESGKPGARDKASASASARETAVPGVKRPAHTIDLKADEVKEDAASGKAGGDGKKTESGKDEKPAAAGAGKGGAKSAPPRKEPPQRTSPVQVAGFVTHLAAGLIGGVAGVLAAGYGLDKLSLGAPSGVPEEFRQTVNGRLAQLEKWVAEGGAREAAGASSAQAELGERIAGLERRMSGLEEGRQAASGATAALQGRIEKLEATLAALERTASQGGDVAGTAAIRARIGEAVSELEPRLAALRSDMDALSSRVEDLSEAAPEGGALAGQAARLEALERGLEAVRDESAGAGGAALAIRLNALSRAAGKGEPYAAQLEALKAAAPDDAGLAALDAWASAGAPSLAALQRRFPERAKAALDAAPAADGDGSLVDRFLDSARSVVRVRRADGEAGGPGAVLSRMESRLREGDLDAAVALAGELPAPGREALAPWLDDARARIALDAALASTSDGLARRLAGAQPR